MPPSAGGFIVVLASGRSASPSLALVCCLGEKTNGCCNRKLNTSPASLDDKDVLKKPLCIPLVRKVDLHFPLGLEVTARNLKGVTIKDALDAIYKQFKKKVSRRQ